MRIRDEYLHGSDLTGVVKKIEVTIGTGNNANKSVIKYIKADSEGGVVEVPIGDITGKAATASKLDNTSAIGSKTNPVYFTANGVPSACTYSLNATVPVGAANKVLYYSASNTLDTQSYTTLTSNLDVFTVATSSAAGKKGLVPAPSANQLGTGNFFLRADGVWTVIENKTAVLNGTATSLVTTGEKYNWNSAYNWYNSMTSGDTDGTINKWKEVEAFLANYGDSSTLAAELAKLVTLSTDQTITGVKTFSEVINGSITGNAGTANKLKNTVNINGVAFDGSADITITAVATGGNSDTVGGYSSSDFLLKTEHETFESIIASALTDLDNRKIEASDIPTSLPANGGNADTVDNLHASDFATADHTHPYLPLSGGTVTGRLTIDTLFDKSLIFDEPTGEKYHIISFRASGEEYSYLCASDLGSNSILSFNGYTIYHSGNLTSSVIGGLGTLSNDISGNAASASNADAATKLKTARTIWGQSFDGTKNIDGYIKININSSPDDIAYYNGLRIHRSVASSDKYAVALMLSAYQNKGIQIIGGGYGGEIRYYDGTSLSNLTYFSSNGNVGIGTTSPSSKLHVAGDIYTTTGFKKEGSDNNYVLLGGGGHKKESELSVNYATSAGSASTADSVDWSGVTNKPSSFTPSSHTHTTSEITNFPTSLPANGGNADTVDGYHASDLYKLISFSPNDGSKDCDDFRSNALYTFNYDFNSTSNTLDNKPLDSNIDGGCSILTVNHGAYSNQIFFDYRGYNLWFRGESYGSSGLIWNPWKRIAITGESQPANGGNADYATSAGTAETANSVEWDNVTNKPTSLPANGGNADYATSAGTANATSHVLYNNEFDTNYGTYAIFQQYYEISDFPHNGWFNSIKMLHNNRAGYFTEIATSFTGVDGMWRRKMYDGEQFGWYKMLDSGNFNSYAPKLDGTGATGTWGINISGNAASASSVDWSGVTNRPTNVSAFYNDKGYLTSHAYSYGSIDIYDVNGAKKTSNNTVSASVNTETLRLQEGANIAITATNSGTSGSDNIKIAVTGITSNIDRNGYGQLALWYNGASSVSTTLQSATFNETLTVKAGVGIDFSGVNSTANNDIWTISAIPYNCAITLNANSTKALIKDSWSADALSVYLTSTGTSGGTSLAAGTYALWIEDRSSASGTPNYYSGTFTCAGSAAAGRLDEIALHSSMATNADTNAPTRIFVATQISGTSGKHVLRFCSLDSNATNHYLTVKVNRII